jgi:pyruvate dehydrogenase E1 component
MLAAQGVNVFVLSVTSWSELARDGMQSESKELNEAKAIPFIAQQLAHTHGPILAASDYVRAVPESIRAYVPQHRLYRTLGTDGFGRSDTRQILREFFGIDAQSIVDTARHLLTQ